MYDEKTEHLFNFAPKEASSSEFICNPALDENDQGWSPSKVFQRHRSLAELSSVAVSEKEALDKNENSQNSDTSGRSQGFESEDYVCINSSKSQTSTSTAITIQLYHVGPTQTVQLTPTKIAEAEGQSNEPLTPTANLKMLMSVVSPAIRDREEKKKDLFFTDTCGGENVTGEVAAEEVIIEKPTVYSRKDKSLGLLCHRFLAKFPENPGHNPIEICLDEVSKDLQVERRRVYDIVNVLESVEVLSRVAKNRYLWHGKTKVANTLGRLKALSKSQENTTPSRKTKEKQGHSSMSKSKMKRHFSSGDVPKQRAHLETNGESSMPRNQLTKHEERLRIKAAIESTDRCRKDKSLGVLSQKFLMMFLLSKGGVVTLEDAANVLLDEHDVGNVKYKTKVRRLYDIANILSSLKLIEKVHIRGISGKKPGFQWIGVDIDSLPENTMPTGPAQTAKTKHSLLPDSTTFTLAKQTGSREQVLPAINKSSTVRWTKSMSCHASIAGCSSTNDSLLKEGQNTDTGAADGFLVHEFASSPITARDMPLHSPTDVTFRKEIQKLQEKFPNRMSQLLAVFPFNSCQASANKSSRRNLFTCNNSSTQNPPTQVTEPNSKRIRKNSIGDFKATGNNSCAQVNTKTSGTKDICISNDENDDPEKNDNPSKFMHSTNSPFKVMSSCAHRQTSGPPFHLVPVDTNEMARNYNENQVLEERRKQQARLQEQQQIYQRMEMQWQQHIAGQLKNPELGPSPRMVQLVDQAVSPIPPSKLVPGTSFAIQASLVKDISPLKPLVFLQPIQSPWKPPAASPSCVPPAPPSTPELPYNLAVGPFQSQANKMYLRSVSPYPVSGSQSCGTSPVGLFSGAKLFFPPSPTPPTSSINGLVPHQAGQLYTLNQITAPIPVSMMSTQTHSCPASVNPSPTPLDTSLPFGSGTVTPGPTPNTSAAIAIPLSMPQETSVQLNNRSDIATPLTQAVNFTPCQYKQQSSIGYSTLLNTRMRVNQAVGLSETPTLAEALMNNVSRKLHLTNEKS